MEMKYIAISSSGGHETELKEALKNIDLQDIKIVKAIEKNFGADYNLPSSRRDKMYKRY